jgi:DNA polymerase III subunit epsilon
MNFLFFDTETTGLPKNWSASYTEVDNWPRVFQLAFILADEQGSVLQAESALIKPDGWVIPQEKFWIENGHSTEKCEERGEPIDQVLDRFMAAKGLADCLVCHNLKFDHRIMWAEIIRSGRQPRSGMEKICTMESSVQFCKVPYAGGKRGYKFPKLIELHMKLFGVGFEGAHDAMADITATMNCFFELVRLGVITLPVIEKAATDA